ncbi:hypothetical protein D3C85_1449640 [compost metagenome]
MICNESPGIKFEAAAPILKEMPLSESALPLMRLFCKAINPATELPDLKSETTTPLILVAPPMASALSARSVPL